MVRWNSDTQRLTRCDGRDGWEVLWRWWDRVGEMGHTEMGAGVGGRMSEKTSLGETWCGGNSDRDKGEQRGTREKGEQGTTALAAKDTVTDMNEYSVALLKLEAKAGHVMWSDFQNVFLNYEWIINRKIFSKEVVLARYYAVTIQVLDVGIASLFQLSRDRKTKITRTEAKTTTKSLW